MKNIKGFESFVRENINMVDLSSENRRIDENTVLYIEGKLTEEEYFAYLNNDLLNEGFVDKAKEVAGKVGNYFNTVKEKILDVFYTFLAHCVKKGGDYISKVMKVVNSVYSWILKFKEKHPVLFKAIIIFIIIMIILILSSQSAHAANGGEITSAGTPPVGKIDTENLNAAIGFIEKNKDNLDGKVFTEAKALLFDLKDGKIDNNLTMSSEAKRLAGMALEQIANMKKLATQNHSEFGAQVLAKISSYISDGANQVYEFTQNSITRVK